jgi:hypothetical protein
MSVDVFLKGSERVSAYDLGTGTVSIRIGDLTLFGSQKALRKTLLAALAAAEDPKQ